MGDTIRSITGDGALKATPPWFSTNITATTNPVQAADDFDDTATTIGKLVIMVKIL